MQHNHDIVKRIQKAIATFRQQFATLTKSIISIADINTFATPIQKKYHLHQHLTNPYEKKQS
jgi:hypothetical protein